MSEERFELSRVSPHGPKPCAYANSATPTNLYLPITYKFYFMNALKSILKRPKSELIFIICALFLIFFIGLKAPSDPDFGWHLRIGQDILKNHAISRYDPYSFTMADFPWVAYTWLADIFVALIEKFFGLFAISLFFAAIGAAAFFVAARAIKTEPIYQLTAALIGAALSVSVVGARIQVFSILGLAILLFILFKWRGNTKSKIIWWLPILFCLWTNIHPAFAVGLALLALFILFELIKGTKYLKSLILVFLSSVAATFINPYTWRIYEEFWRTTSDFAGRAQIAEWQPLLKTPILIFAPVIIFALFIFGFLFFSKKRDLTLIGISAIFFILALLAWRNLPLFLITAIPILILALQNIAGKQLLNLLAAPLVLLALAGIVIFVGWRNTKEVWLADSNQELFAQQAQFPYNAVNFLKSNHLPPAGDHLFNDYNWGGYILWQMPDQKIFIDGEMPHWQLPGKHIFLDYLALQNVKDPNVIKKYNLNLALIARDSPLASFLKISGWQKIYEDNLAIILKK